MKQQTGAPNAKRSATFILDKSCWINVCGSENAAAKDHFVKAQGEVVLKLLEEKFRKDQSEIPRLFIITPFTSVKEGMKNLITKSALYKKEPRTEKWLKDNNVGTVHTFQGQGTDEVIFLLGCDKNATGAANWVNKNIVNVAATRAKFRFYIIGDKNVWTCRPVRVARECTAELIEAADLDDILHLPDSASQNLCRADSAAPLPAPKEVAMQQPKIPAAAPAPSAAPTQQTRNPAAAPAPSAAPTQLAKNPAAAAPKYGNTAAKKAVCPKCGKPLSEKNGKFGKFLGCSGFPGCRYTTSLPKSN